MGVIVGRTGVLPHEPSVPVPFWPEFDGGPIRRICRMRMPDRQSFAQPSVVASTAPDRLTFGTWQPT